MSKSESNAVSELDLALLNALQMAPRAEWGELADALGVSAATAARRWKALRSQGLAWVGATVGPQGAQDIASAFALVTCERKAAEVAARLAHEPEIATITATMGRHDLLIDVLVPDLESLRHYLAGRLAGLDDIASVTSFPITTIFTEGSRWRVRALDADQMRHLGGGVTPARRRSAPRIDHLDRSLIGALVADGRRSWAELAQTCGTSAPTARRRVERLLDTGTIELRCELATPLVGPAVHVTFLLEVPALRIADVGRQLAATPQCRVAAAVVERSNFVVTMWFAHAGEIAAFERSLITTFPGLHVADRIVHMQAIKRIGHLLDAGHRSVGVVPLAAW